MDLESIYFMVSATAAYFVHILEESPRFDTLGAEISGST